MKMTRGNRKPKRLVALFVALAMVFTLGLTAMAENLTEVGVSPALPQEGYLKSDIRVEIHADTLFDLLEQHVFDGQTDREGVWQIRGIVEGINKLDATVVQGADVFQLLIGGEDKTPVSVQIALGGEGDTAHITSSALPGIQLSVPKAAIFAAFKQQQEEAPPVEFTAASAQRYAEVFGQYIAGLTQSAAEGTEEGVFEIGGVGQFTKKTVFDIDSKGITQLLSNLLEALKQDNDTQALLDGYLATAEDTTTKSAAEFIAEAEKAIGEEQQKENRVVAHHTGYESADGLTKYSETETTSSAADVPAMMIALYQQADAEGNEEYTQVHITVNNPEAEAATAPDWVAISQGVLDGTNKNAMVLTVESRSAKGAQEDARNTESTVGFHTAQGYFGVIARDETAGFSSKGSLSIAALSPDPLFTLHYNSVPAAAALDLGLTANAVTINAGDAISDEEGNLIAQTLFEKGLPAIFEALPDEVAQFLSIVLEPSEAEVPGEVPAAS